VRKATLAQHPAQDPTGSASKRAPGARLRSHGVRTRLQDGPGGNRVEAEGFAVPVRALEGLAQDEEPSVRGGKAGGGGGLEAPMAMKALMSADRCHPKQDVELQFESQQAANEAVGKLNSGRPG
jgi:hypothetical protein